jgi:uncharacterized protein (TIGR02186 family)
MRLRRAFALAILAAASAAPAPAAAEQLVISISRHQVMVSSSFTGTSIVLFGTIEPDNTVARRRSTRYDIVATVTGPRQNVVNRRKERVFGIWANVDSRTFINVPSYLAVLASRPFENMSDPDILRRLQIGLDNFLLPQQIGPDIADVVREDPFRRAFIRLKTEHRLYLQRTDGITFLTPTVFRAEIPLPAITPVGNYDVNVMLFAENSLLARTHSAFEIVKVGFEQFVATAAREHGFLYGITTAFMAVFTGWFASVVFRRD